MPAISEASGHHSAAHCASSTTAATASAGSSSNGGSKATTSCASIPASEVNTDLGTSVGPPSSEIQGSVVVCTYKSSTAPQSAIVRIETGTDAAAFVASKAQFATQGQTTPDAPGLGDQAYTSTLTAGGITNSTVVVLKGTTSILVTGSATVPQGEALAARILATR
jgi:hypothetical protein